MAEVPIVRLIMSPPAQAEESIVEHSMIQGDETTNVAEYPSMANLLIATADAVEQVVVSWWSLLIARLVMIPNGIWESACVLPLFCVFVFASCWFGCVKVVAVAWNPKPFNGVRLQTPEASDS
jgi:hypothetical protein